MIIGEESEGNLSHIDPLLHIETYDGDITGMTFNHVKSSKVFNPKEKDSLFEILSEDDESESTQIS